MKQQIRYIVALLVASFCIACHTDLNVTPSIIESNTADGWVAVEFTTNAPTMTEVEVRAADPDGIDVHNLTLFCFNDFGLYLAHVEADLTSATPLSGSYKAVIPEDTRIIHFVGNQNPSLYDSNMFINRTEDEIQDDMVGASGMIIYWSRFVFNSKDEFQNQLANANGGEGIKLIRNQAKISIENAHDNDFIDISGWVVTNIHAYGTTAPYHPVHRFPTDGSSFSWPGDDYVTLPSNRTKLSDIIDVTTRTEEYIFEHENKLIDPVSIIIKGTPKGSNEELYYRVSIIDETGEQLMIRRNHHYKLNITGELTYGSKSFNEAMASPATNNIWVNVEDWVNEVSFDGITLRVDQTSFVLSEDYAGKSLEVKYSISSTEGLNDLDIAEVTWADGNTVAAHNFNHTFTANGNEGIGTIGLQLLEMGDNAKLEGKLIIKKGRLQRTIDIVIIKTQKFTPVWAATQIYGGDIGELATFKFNVPEDFPLFPFNVYVTVNSLDVRSETTGRVLPVVHKNSEGWYGVDNSLGYKYVYTVTEPGAQRLYFHSVLRHENGGSDNIMIEAEFFKTETKEFFYVSHQNALNVADLERYSMSGINDEYIFYRLVPRKINAPVRLDVLLEDVSNGEDNPERRDAEADDEFLIYTRTLDTLSDQSDLAMFDLPAEWQQDCRYYAVDEDIWQVSSNGRTMMFQPTTLVKDGDDKGKYTLLLKTNRSRSNDMIRIASNSPENFSAVTGQTNQNYNGNTYRSFIFELSTYRPFRFAAQIAINGGTPQGTWNTAVDKLTEPDPVDYLSWTYIPNQKVDINLDITSFMGSDGKSADPFGTSFEVYIDAPMLNIDYSRLTAEMASKLKPHATIPGRFVYTVDASREEERKTGNGLDVMFKDDAAVSQSGERKTLPFVTSRITTSGEIVISSQNEICEFFEKRFKINNTLISGAIKYEKNGVQQSVAHSEFVSFAVERTSVRIGSMNIPEDGKFTLNLRAEYSFTWDDDAVKLSYINGNDVYEKVFPSLKALYYSVVTNNETIILEQTE